MSTKEPTDWAEIRRRIDFIRAGMEQGLAPSPEADQRILKARARELAREPERTVTAEETIEVIEFDLADERYEIGRAHV